MQRAHVAGTQSERTHDDNNVGFSPIEFCYGGLCLSSSTCSFLCNDYGDDTTTVLIKITTQTESKMTCAISEDPFESTSFSVALIKILVSHWRSVAHTLCM